MGRTKFHMQVDGRLCVLLSLMLILLPLPWVLAAALAAAFHELCHAVTILLLHGSIYALQIDAGGIRMETSSMTPIRETIAAMAGPLGSAALMFFAPWLPRTAVCGAVHCVFNLLPFFPLDGGRILQNFFMIALPANRWQKAFDCLQLAFRVCFAAFCIVFGLWKGIWFAVAASVLFLRQRKKRTV